MNKVMRYVFLAVFALAGTGFFLNDVLAAPAISSVSGTPAHGNNVTISGTGFGTKSPVAPYIWANFDDGSSQPSNLSQLSSWNVYNFTPTAGVGVRNTVGMQSYLWNYQEQNFGALMGVNGVNFNTYGLHWYVFRKGKRNWTITDAFNWKNLRFWYASGSLYTQTGNGSVSEEGFPNAGYMCAWQSPLSSQCTDDITVDQTRGYSDGRWNTEQYIGAPQSGAGQTDGFFHYIVNGRTAVKIPYTDYAQKVFVMAQGSARESYFVHDESANEPDPPAGARTWWDDVYVDRTWSRVMLSNRSTWGTSSTGPLYEIQIPTAWSNTSITVQLNQGEFQNGATAYLYVVDANNDANPNGFPVTIDGGGGGDTTPPIVSLTAPSGGATVSGTTTVSATASDNSGTVSGVQFRLDGTNLGAEDTTSPFSTSWNTTTATNGAHTLTAIARDPSGNTATSSSVSVTVNNGDTAPPTSPSGLGANATSTSSITVSWTASTDNVGVTGYIVERCQGSGCTNFAQVGTPTASPFVDSGLTPNTFYNYHVRARDAAGNLSGWSNVVGATTQSGTPAPSFTLTANPTSIASGQSSMLTWSSVTNATSCTATGGTFTGSKSTSGGTQSVSPTSTTTYTLSCTGAGGTTNRTATVTVGGGGDVSMNECSSMQSGWIFCDDFDTGVATDTERRARWDDGDGGLDANFPVNTGPSQQSTNHVAQLRAPVGQRGGADLIKYNLPGGFYDRLYARYYIQYESGFNFNAPNHGGGFMGGNSDYYWRDSIRPNGSDVFTAWVDYRSSAPHTPFFYTYYADMYQDCSDPNGACWGDSFPCVYGSGYCSKPQHLPTGTLPNLEASRWYCVETMLDAGTPTPSGSGASGAMQLWLDGQSIGSWNDLWFRNTSTLRINAFELSLFHHDGTHSVGGVLYDNVVLSTSQVGCGSAPGGDITPPVLPANFNLAANATSTSSITVTWNPATDNVGVTGYQVERCTGLSCSNFANVGNPTASPFVNSGLTMGTGYSYHVRAVDAAGNFSPWSNVVGATTQSTTQVACNTVTPSNFSQAAYNSYGAPYDLFASNAQLVDAKCTSADTRTINATIGKTGDTTRIVYTKGYYYDPGISNWAQYTSTCSGTLNGDWCAGPVTATITDADLSTTSAGTPAYFVGMVCSVQGGGWKCGCRDTTCGNFYWMIQGAGM